MQRKCAINRVSARETKTWNNGKSSQRERERERLKCSKKTYRV